MAAYSQTSGFLTSIKRVMEIWNNTINKQMLQEIFVLIDTEFAAMASAGLAFYTVTTGLEASLLARLNNMSNNTLRLAVQDMIGYLMVEFAAVETNGLSYEVTDFSVGAAWGAVLGMKRSMDNTPNITHRICMDQIIDILSTELTALEDAS